MPQDKPNIVKKRVSETKVEIYTTITNKDGWDSADKLRNKEVNLAEIARLEAENEKIDADIREMQAMTIEPVDPEVTDESNS